MKKILVILILSIGFYSCEVEFSPFSQLENNIMVFSVLDNRLPYQFVRLQKFYQDPEKKKLGENCSILLSDSKGNTYQYRDTSFSSDPDFSYYYLPDAKLLRGEQHELKISYSSFPTISAVTKIPVNPDLKNYITTKVTPSMEEEYSYDFTFVNNCSQYFYFKAKLFYDVKSGSSISSHWIEIPVDAKIKLDYYNPTLSFMDHPLSYITAIFPVFMKRGEDINNVSPISSGGVYRAKFSHNAILYALRRIQGNHVQSDIIIKGAELVFHSVSDEYYEEYVHIGREYFSVRLDQPFYSSNIKLGKNQGFGFFGSVTADTIKFKILAEHLMYFNYEDRQ